MSKGLKIGIVIAVIAIVCVVGFLIVRNLGGKSVGIDPNTTTHKITITAITIPIFDPLLIIIRSN